MGKIYCKDMSYLIFMLLLLSSLGCQKIDYEAIAKGITKEAKANLTEKLTTSIAAGGTVQAIPFCKQNAGPFTNALGMKNDVLLRRISDKPRNPLNVVSDEERRIFLEIGANQSKEGEYPTKTVVKKDFVTVYIPIPTAGLCLQCHGEPNLDIKKDTLMVLQKEYPGDLARGYRVGSLRGLFSVRFAK
ncbi:PF11845 family protein [Leptospira wolbachii serovar Codice str. CDC]|uniref:PF11845 family protein n=1 Tax=Leptospira wolbachii serovar Codice str. CDC TaxID=1218599 RepID=R9A604_9LEPT|nr:PF11845 family protein [Leptospira wolbachii serovar Codice str. CDC]